MYMMILNHVQKWWPRHVFCGLFLVPMFRVLLSFRHSLRNSSNNCFYADAVFTTNPCSPDLFCMLWACWSYLGTVLWSCNQVYDGGNDGSLKILARWFCYALVTGVLTMFLNEVMTPLIFTGPFGWISENFTLLMNDGPKVCLLTFFYGVAVARVYFSPKEGLVRIVRSWSLTKSYGFDHFDCSPLRSPVCWCVFLAFAYHMLSQKRSMIIMVVVVWVKMILPMALHRIVYGLVPYRIILNHVHMRWCHYNVWYYGSVCVKAVTAVHGSSLWMVSLPTGLDLLLYYKSEVVRRWCTGLVLASYMPSRRNLKLGTVLVICTSFGFWWGCVKICLGYGWDRCADLMMMATWAAMLVCWFLLVTGFWNCNHVLECGDDAFDGWLFRLDICRLCTTGESWTQGMFSYSCFGVVEVPDSLGKYLLWSFVNNLRWSTYMGVLMGIIQLAMHYRNLISFCAGLLFGCLEDSRLCTTEPNRNFCAGLLFIFVRSAGQIVMHYNNDCFISAPTFWFCRMTMDYLVGLPDG